MNRFQHCFIYFLSIVFILGVPFNAYAQSTAPVTTTSATNAGTTQTNTAQADNRIANLKARALQEITRRINSMNNAITRISAMKKLPANTISTLTSGIQTQIASLQALQTKINGDTDLATLKADVQAIVSSYRIYALYLPQTHITAAADSILNSDNLIASFEAKIQARITAAQNAGNDVTALNTAFADLQAKLTDANTQANNAITTVSSLSPTGYPGNKSTLQSAQSFLMIARQDLKGIRQDIATILTGLRNMKKSGSAVTVTPAVSSVPSPTH